MKKERSTMSKADVLTRKILRDVSRTQRLRHLVANKLTLPLTVLHCLRDGQPVPHRLFQRAIRDLEAIMRGVDQEIKRRA